MVVDTDTEFVYALSHNGRKMLASRRGDEWWDVFEEIASICYLKESTPTKAGAVDYIRISLRLQEEELLW